MSGEMHLSDEISAVFGHWSKEIDGMIAQDPTALASQVSDAIMVLAAKGHVPIPAVIDAVREGTMLSGWEVAYNLIEKRVDEWNQSQ
jgi:TRAP-type mannitol/chloroaromatic compound transport system substrate-binding protein